MHLRYNQIVEKVIWDYKIQKSIWLPPSTVGKRP